MWEGRPRREQGEGPECGGGRGWIQRPDCGTQCARGGTGGSGGTSPQRVLYLKPEERARLCLHWGRPGNTDLGPGGAPGSHGGGAAGVPPRGDHLWGCWEGARDPLGHTPGEAQSAGSS
ncbi:hypothetical protein NDU88_005163 [Pleurodeles waltl]|uniref:Uncharacterized protein n=1 Tax=Pleurodeles waltl TaxID=8319 RepID=A0AAV7WBX9_PLEWA|nr:hypothetical protein NDU88_005163 [Pleurodeles waltl]